MGLFGKRKAERELDEAHAAIDMLIERTAELEILCEAKDDATKAIMSDGLRHGSPLAAREMVARREYLKTERKKKS